MTRTCFVVSLLAALASGCKSDLGSSCVLQQANPDGGEPLTVRERSLTAGQLFLSSTTGCDHQLCLRDGHFVADAGSDQPAEGYCSATCDHSAFDPCGAGGLTCQDLLLDPATLDRLDGGLATLKSSYCARP